MTTRRSNQDHVLASALKTVTYIVNLVFPNESGEETTEEFLKRVRYRTDALWPELWEADVDEAPPEIPLRHMRDLLLRFWLATDGRARDWYIHRAREYYQRMRLTRRLAKEGQVAVISEALRATLLQLKTIREERDAARNAPTKEEAFSLWADADSRLEKLMDEAPPSTDFEDALFALQERARYPSTSPLRCPNCIQKRGAGPFFLSERKGQKFCSPECFQASQRKIKRESWQSHQKEWRKKK